MRFHVRRVAVVLTACVGALGLSACADDEVVYVDRTPVNYVPVQAVEASTYRGAAGYRHPVGDSGLRQLDREYLRTTTPQGPATSAGYSIPVQAGAGVGGASPAERPAAPPPAAAAPIQPPRGAGVVAPPSNPALQSEAIEAPVSSPPPLPPPVAPADAAPPAAPSPAPAPAPIPAPGPGNTISTQPGAEPPAPAPQPAPAPNPNEALPEPPERPQLPGADDAEPRP